MNFRQRARRFGVIIRRHKKSVIISSICLVLIMVGAYAYASYNYWQQYQARTHSELAAYKTQIDNALRLATSTGKLPPLEELATSDKDNDTCKASGLFSWQGSYSQSIKDKQAACSMREEKLAVLTKCLKDMTNYLKAERQAALYIQQTQSTAELTEVNWSEQAASWQKAQQQLSTMSTPDSFEAVKKRVLENTEAITGAWSELLAAHVAKDEAAFSGASARLTAAYQALPEASVMSKQTLAGLHDSFKQSYVATFDQ